MTDDAERYPTLSEHGAAMLRFLREHPHAPIFRNESGNRLTAEDVARVRAFEREVDAAGTGWPPEREPEWVAGFVDRAVADVPFYREHAAGIRSLADLPTISRADLGQDVTRFFPDSQPIERLINFSTSGTTGHALLLASHPVVAASYLAFHKKALRRFGIELSHGRGQVGVVLIGWQRRCFTYVSVTPTMGESGLVKLNLHPDDWRDPGDRARYLDALRAEVWTGDPLAFAELALLPVTARPRALLSTSMTLSPGFKKELEARFGCPVLDLYSLNEAGPVAVADERAGGHVLLQHRLFVEILDRAGGRVGAGERGEITLTGGFNFCLPLVRYRTGDFASLRHAHGEPVLVDLEGRPPVRFRAAGGAWLNNIEVTHALKPFALRQWTLRQRRDGTLHLKVLGASAPVGQLRMALLELFGAAQPLEVEPVASLGDKVVQYTSELTEPAR